ncbi:MAG: pirin family protein [Acidobacteria bacterium]|nr:pirin family protein [Acidobacteriota bacterium]
MKKLATIHRSTDKHWVGDGFPVRTVFSYHSQGLHVSPFLLMDYAGPVEFPPAAKPRGVGWHPHRGFETVTIVYQGEVEHRDTTGNGGKIGPGDVQWMTAAGGLLHEEMHSQEFTKKGGTFEVIQLWVNIPSQDKLSPPHYQAITDAQIPSVALNSDGSFARVISGELHGVNGPAATFTPVNLWDLRLRAGNKVELNIPEGFTTLLFVLNGAVQVNGAQDINATELAAFDRSGEMISMISKEDSMVLVMSGQPIDEPIAGYGPFVMNNEDQIRQALKDFNSGRMAEMIAAVEAN